VKIDDHGMMAAKEGDRVEGGRWGQEQGGGMYAAASKGRLLLKSDGGMYNIHCAFSVEH